MAQLCSCGLAFTIERGARVCRHCDRPSSHVAALCPRCRALMPTTKR